MKTLKNVMVVEMAAVHIIRRNLQNMTNKPKPADHKLQSVKKHGKLKAVLQVWQIFRQNWWFPNWRMLGLMVLGRFRKYYIKKLLQVRKFKAFSSKEATMFIAEPLGCIVARSLFDMCIEFM